MASYSDNSYVICKELYNFVAEHLKTNDSKFRANIAKFINDRHEIIFDIAPYDNILFNQTDKDNMFNSLGITEAQAEQYLKKCYFWDLPNFNPPCAKEPYVEVLMAAIRYYIKNNQSKNAELTAVYLAFSGKIYASVFAGLAFPKAPPSKNKAAMDYVVNNMLTEKFDLKREGSVFGAIKSLCCTWLETYKKDIAGPNSSDDDIRLVIQQLRGRVKSFLMNIAKLYYQACENKNYLNYETDDFNEDSFRLTNSDATTAARLTDNTMNYITSTYVSIDICNKCKDENVKALEIKDIMECILGDNNNLPDVRKVINILICDFMRSNPGKKVGSIDFVSYSIKSKPNTKDEYLLELKRIILGWLEDNSPTYRKRKSREATRNSYYRSILMYFVLIINKIAR